MDDIVTTEQEDPILQMRGVGKEIWAATDADEYMHDLRSDRMESGEDRGERSEDGSTRV